MKVRVLLIFAVIFVVSAVVYGQTGLAGKWQTDNVPAALEAQKAAQGQPAPEPSPRLAILEVVLGRRPSPPGRGLSACEARAR